MNKKETKKSNKQLVTNVNSCITGATLQSSSESAAHGLVNAKIKVLNNEQAIASKGALNSDIK